MIAKLNYNSQSTNAVNKTKVKLHLFALHLWLQIFITIITNAFHTTCSVHLCTYTVLLVTHSTSCAYCQSYKTTISI